MKNVLLWNTNYWIHFSKIVVFLLFIYSSYFYNLGNWKYKVTYMVYKICAKSHYSTTTTKG